MVTRHSWRTVSPPIPESKTPTGRSSTRRSLGGLSARPLVPRAGVVPRVVAGRPQDLHRRRGSASGVAVRDELGAVGQPDPLVDLFLTQLHQLRDVEVPGARDVALPRVARVAGLAGELRLAAHVEERQLLAAADQLLELDVQETSSSSGAIAGRRASRSTQSATAGKSEWSIRAIHGTYAMSARPYAVPVRYGRSSSSASSSPSLVSRSPRAPSSPRRSL